MTYLKKSLLLIIILLLSGCSVEYNLVINKDLTINESVTAKEEEKVLRTLTGLDSNEAVNALYEKFNREGLNSTLSSKENDGNIIATVRARFNTLEDYASNFTSDLYKEVNVTKKDDIVTLTIDQTAPFTSEGRNVLVYDNITVNITVPFTVTDHNADSVKKNTYTWIINKDGESKDIMISYDENSYNNSIKITIGKNSFNFKYSYIAILIILLIIGMIALVVFINNKKNNKV